MAERLDELTAAMADLTGTLETAPDNAEVFEAICGEAVTVIEGADLASITLVGENGPETAAWTHDTAYELDQAQYAAGDGPCLRAAASGEVVRLGVSRARETWPVFTAAAGERGVGSYLAAPLWVDERLSGAVNLFGYGDHGFEELDTKVLRLYTVVVVSVLRTARRYQQAQELAESLDAAMRNRAVIEQAKGILMAVHRVDEEQAMRRLITESQHTNVKLREVAARFVRDLTAG
ncbi:GAF and ANTAR domain-containing protein [Amycolatopsis sp. PS_44_ISF1]|uniref:GAF and ANTAR domain-containing protein n=1 Tax=Amycolatopsis sp. PS_44_ISF1 TaxID=2974917 RepID=UPI0028DE3ED7|nr:GAF and ANTAR domain-containing protein [Amycolatopsis sp. PS_44_ISF1]MDT8911438.1 GAF and ANTAR domain-containing protein [Amycolatopsis sp. PS_44_ISF1]